MEEQQIEVRAQQQATFFAFAHNVSINQSSLSRVHGRLLDHGADPGEQEDGADLDERVSSLDPGDGKDWRFKGS